MWHTPFSFSNFKRMGRILAIDYGMRRTGIAVTDPLQIIAGGLTTVDTRELMPYLEKYMETESVDKIVVGLPLQMNGEESDNAKNVRLFVRKLRQKNPSLDVEYFDERFTSVLAKNAMISGGVPKMKRRNKAMVDEISATIILQSYMEQKKYNILK